MCINRFPEKRLISIKQKTFSVRFQKYAILSVKNSDFNPKVDICCLFFFFMIYHRCFIIAYLFSVFRSIRTVFHVKNKFQKFAILFPKKTFNLKITKRDRF